MKSVKDYVTTIPDFPEKGILFRDITTVLQDAEGFKLAIDEFLKLLEGVEFDVIAGAESRGFIFGAPLAYLLNKPFVLIRKKGKLPRETVTKEYLKAFPYLQGKYSFHICESADGVHLS